MSSNEEMLSLKFFLTVTPKPGVELGPTSSIRRLAVPKRTSLDGLFQVMTRCLLGRVGRSDAVAVAFELSYVDEDGDTVLVGSEPEWEEAVAQNGDSVLKLRVTAVITHVTDGEQGASDDEGATTEQAAAEASTTQAPAAPAAPGPSVQGTLSLEDRSGATTEQAVAEASTTQAPAAPVPAAPGPSVQGTLPHIAPMVALLSVLCDCDAEAELASTSPVARLAALVERRVDAQNQYVDIHINKNAVRHEVHVRSAVLLDEEKHQEAADLLEAGVSVYPSDMIMLYNYACALALLQKDAATVVGVLRRAIDCGYGDFEHLRRDQDLASVRGSAELRQLLGEHVGEPVMKLMDVFPQLSVSDATRLLGRFDGNIHAATMHVLEGLSYRSLF